MPGLWLLVFIDESSAREDDSSIFDLLRMQWLTEGEKCGYKAQERCLESR